MNRPLFFPPLPIDVGLVLAQIAPTDVNTPWMWLSGILATGIAVLFGLYTKKILSGESEWKATAKEGSVEFPKMRETLDKAVGILGTQQTLIEAQAREISQLKDIVTRVERHVEDLRLSIKTDAQLRQRMGEQQ